MSTKPIKAFTILETLLSLMLMSIIITVSYLLFNLLEKQLYMFQEENTQVLEYNLFNSALKRDIYNASSFKFTYGNLILKFYDETEVGYVISPQHILRNNTIKTDTFKLKALDFRFFDASKDNLSHMLSISINVLNDTVNTNYFIKKDISKIINQTYFNED